MPPEFQSQWKVKPFHGAYIHFLGFPEEERVHMASELARNGGKECADYRRDRCTHVVVDGGGEISTVPADVPKEALVVKVEDVIRSAFVVGSSFRRNFGDLG